MPSPIEAIRNQFAAISPQPLPAAGIMGHLTFNYRVYVRKQLTQLLKTNNEDKLVAEARAFLGVHWKKIKGTCLSYTAHPGLDIHRILYQLADMVCQSCNDVDHSLQDQRAPIEFLMPGIELNSTNPDYPNFNVVKPTTFSQEEQQELIRLEQLNARKLISESECITDEELLMLNTVLKLKTYLAQDKDKEVLSEQDHQLLKECDTKAIANLERKKEVKNSWSKLASLRYKRKAIEDEKSLHIEKSGLLYPKEGLEALMQTHILSESGSSLIPASLVMQKSSDLYNPYSNYERITKNESDRLASHSSEARAFLETRSRLNDFLKEDSHLLGRLMRLCEQLKANDAHAGHGHIEDAAMGAYPAIIQFNDYYSTLDDTSKWKIPEELRDEVDLLLSLSEDPKKNIEATANIDTCIGTRREKLEEHIRGNEELLAGIATSEQKKRELITQAQKKHKEAASAFSGMIESGSYDGCDQLPFSKEILDTYAVMLSPQSLADLRAIMALSPNEIRSLIAEETTKNQVANILSLEELIWFIHENSTLQLDVFFEIAAPYLLDRFENDDIPTLLQTLTREKFEIVGRALIKSKLNIGFLSILLHMENEEGFIRFFMILPSNKRAEVAATSQLLSHNYLIQALQEKRYAIFETLLNAVDKANQGHALALDNPDSWMCRYGLGELLKAPALFLRIIKLFKKKSDRDAALFGTSGTDANGSPSLALSEWAIRDVESIKLYSECFEDKDAFLTQIMLRNEEGLSVFLDSAKFKETFLYLLQTYFPDSDKQHQLLRGLMHYGQGYTLLHNVRSKEVAELVLSSYNTDEERFGMMTHQNNHGSSPLHYASPNSEAFKELLSCIPAHRRLDALKIEEGHIDREKLYLYLSRYHAGSLKEAFLLLPINDQLKIMFEKPKKYRSFHQVLGGRDGLLGLFVLANSGQDKAGADASNLGQLRNILQAYGSYLKEHSSAGHYLSTMFSTKRQEMARELVNLRYCLGKLDRGDEGFKYTSILRKGRFSHVVKACERLNNNPGVTP